MTRTWAFGVLATLRKVESERPSYAGDSSLLICCWETCPVREFLDGLKLRDPGDFAA
jgi:hypothetical protein